MTMIVWWTECTWLCYYYYGMCCTVVDICTMPVDTGPCEAQLESWYYNQETGLCELFTYGGCQGNDNRFESEIECRDMCDAQEPIGELFKANLICYACILYPHELQTLEMLIFGP